MLNSVNVRDPVQNFVAKLLSHYEEEKRALTLLPKFDILLDLVGRAPDKVFMLINSANL